MEQQLELSQTFVLSGRMIQSFRVLQMNAAELHDYLETVSLDNPVIETEYADGFHGLSESHGELSADIYDSFSGQETLAEHLRKQWTGPLTPRDNMILTYILHSLDWRGYFTEAPGISAAVLNVSTEDVLRILHKIQTLEPAGAAAADLRECLLLQADREYGIAPLHELISSHLELVAKNHISKIAAALDTDIEEAEDLCGIIRSLNPFPGSAYQVPDPASAVIPDVIIREDEGVLKAFLNESYEIKIHLNKQYLSIAGNADRQTREYLEKKIRQADWIRNCLERRNTTLIGICSFILEQQKSFFSNPEGRLRSLMMKDAAARADVHQSTVTRAVKGKYLECSRGIFPLRSFFSCGGKDGWSRNAIMEQIETIILSEDPAHPCSDQKIAGILGEKGVNISRRTVAKYRASMGIKDMEGRRNYNLI